MIYCSFLIFEGEKCTREHFTVENFQIFMVVCFLAVGSVKVHVLNCLNHNKPAIARVVDPPQAGRQAGSVLDRGNICLVQGVKCFSVIGNLRAKCRCVTLALVVPRRCLHTACTK